jgi:alpha-N-arabinofuranosidase
MAHPGQDRRHDQARTHRAEGLEGNLLPNADFEQMNGGLPTQWLLDPALAERGEATVESISSGSSRRALKLSPNGRNTDKQKPFGIGQVIPARELKGKKLLVEAAMRTDGGAVGLVMVVALTDSGKSVHSVFLTQIDSAPNFILQKGYLDVANASKIIVGCVTNSVQGSVWFSQLYLGPESAAAAEPSSNPLEVSATSIRVEADRVLRSIPRSLYGTNAEWVRNGDGVFDSSRRAPRTEVVRLARELGVGLVRYPGGGFADYFHWKDAIGSVGTRPVRSYVLDSGRSRADFGIPEFMTFCQQINAEPLMQINVLTGTVEEAASFVSYCNSSNHSDRARDGSPQPYRVRYWEIGNEQYIHNESSDQIGGIPTGSYLPVNEYVQRFQQISSAMRKIDPSVLIGAIGGKNFGRYRLVHDEDWDRTLLEKAGSMIDFLAVHNSYAPLALDDRQSSLEDVYQAMLAFPKLVEENIEAIAGEIDHYAPSRSKHIKIAVTEWGPLFSFLPTSRWVDHVKTLGSALYVASLFQVFLKSDRVDITNFFKLTGDSFVGCIAGNGEPKPIYYGLQMYYQHFGSKLIQARVSGPTFDSQAIGLVAAVQRVPYLDAVASLSEDGSKLFIIAVNKSFDNPLPTQVLINGFRPSSRARVWVLTAPSLDANNGADLPQFFGLGWAKQATASRASMFGDGKPGTVVPKASEFSSASTDFSFTFVPRSVTALEFSREEGR